MTWLLSHGPWKVLDSSRKRGVGGGGNRTLEEGEAKLAAYDDGGRRGWSAYPDGWMDE
jgi:hypothetical protein